MTGPRRLVTWLNAGAWVFAVHCSTSGSLHAHTLRPSPSNSRVVAPPLRVLPWDGHKAALTLTFDDTSPSEGTEALPELDEKGVKATFFVTTANNWSKGFNQIWARAEREGHELGNHTVDHCHSAALGQGRCLSATAELEQCNQYIESKLGAPGVYTFAYPFVDQGAAYKTAASDEFLLARAGAGGLVGSASTPDWYSMDAKFVEPTHGETVKDWDGWIDDADARSKWLILVFHSILPETWCEGISRGQLGAIVDHAKAADDLWIDTFVDVGAYLRAERLFDSTVPERHGNGFSWNWVLPRHFPRGKSLRFVLGTGTITQNGVPAPRDPHGNYLVQLDAGALDWSP